MGPNFNVFLDMSVRIFVALDAVTRHGGGRRSAPLDTYIDTYYNTQPARFSRTSAVSTHENHAKVLTSPEILALQNGFEGNFDPLAVGKGQYASQKVISL